MIQNNPSSTTLHSNSCFVLLQNGSNWFSNSALRGRKHVASTGKLHFSCTRGEIGGSWSWCCKGERPVATGLLLISLCYEKRNICDDFQKGCCFPDGIWSDLRFIEIKKDGVFTNLETQRCLVLVFFSVFQPWGLNCPSRGVVWGGVGDGTHPSSWM